MHWKDFMEKVLYLSGFKGMKTEIGDIIALINHRPEFSTESKISTYPSGMLKNDISESIDKLIDSV